MKLNKLASYGIFVGTLIVMTFTIQSVKAQGASKGAPVTVINTPANPVPVTGQVTIGNMPTVDARQNGEWNVGINGRPFVKIDPNENNVKVAPVLLFTDFRRVNWTGQGSVVVDYGGLTSKVRLCVKHSASEPIQIDFVTWIFAGSGDADSFRVDAFTMSTPGQVCKAYELTGTLVSVKVSNTGNNTSGQDSFGILAYQ